MILSVENALRSEQKHASRRGSNSSHRTGQEEELPVVLLLPVAEGQEVLLRSPGVTLKHVPVNKSPRLTEQILVSAGLCFRFIFIRGIRGFLTFRITKGVSWTSNHLLWDVKRGVVMYKRIEEQRMVAETDHTLYINVYSSKSEDWRDLCQG